MNNINIIIAEASVDLVPKSWLKEKKIKQYYNKHKRLPLIDASKHQHLLKSIPRSQRLDRPDILHFGLLTLLGYTSIIKNINPYFSCSKGLFSVLPSTRLPRSQTRFYGILEQLLSNNYSGDHISRVGTDVNSLTGKKVFFSIRGETMTREIAEYSNFIFGGFSTGYYNTTIGGDDIVVSISSKPLELWTAISLFLNRFNNFTS